ncbi:MAG: LysR family transcriptional regulator [Alphaproteobacteria bacterium]|nr:LysR family transcriptional regulator [Alphaproteobacteria bacterium]
MEMHQIRYFLAVCETLNFTRAAEQCHVTQPALTRAIQKLEEELGGLLFRRERSLTHVTDLGRLMQPHLAQVLAEASAAQTTAKSFLKLEQAPLNLGVMCTIGPLKMVGFLAAFRRQHPGIEISIKEGLPDALGDMTLEGQIDLALLARPEPLGERFDVRPIYRDRYVVMFPAGHRLGQLNAVPLKEIEGEPMISRTNCEYHDHVRAICRQRLIRATIVYGSEREDWVQAMVAGGLGLCLAWESSTTIPGVQTRRIIDPDVARDISLVSVAGRRFSPAALALLRFAKAYPWLE